MAAENSSAVAAKTAVRQVEKGKMASFCGFLYDKKSGTVLGRTGKSWLEIIIFYIIFYSCLAAFFILNLAIFLQTLNPNYPRYYGKGSIIGINPGLGYQPWIKTNAESTLISFDPKNNETYGVFTSTLQTFWNLYNSSGQGLRTCPGDESNRDNATSACIFDLSPFEAAQCGPPHFGFDKGEPCVILTLNKLLGWEPLMFPKDSLPKALPPQVKSAYNGDVSVACEGEYIKETIGELEYIPPSGINRKFFPYKFMKSYQQPFAMVKFKGLREGVLVQVECKAYAYNIVHDRTNRLGMIHFEMLRLVPKNATV